jgi:hypothetical protein
LVIVLSVLRFTTSDNPFGIFKFLDINQKRTNNTITERHQRGNQMS